MYEGNIKLDIITCLDSIIGQYPALRLADDRPMIESDHVILSDFMLPPYIDLDYMNPCSFMAHKLWDNLGPKLETVPNRDDQKNNHRDKIIGSVTTAKMIMPGGFTGSLFRIDP